MRFLPWKAARKMSMTTFLAGILVRTDRNLGLAVIQVNISSGAHARLRVPRDWREPVLLHGYLLSSKKPLEPTGRLAFDTGNALQQFTVVRLPSVTS
jgi:hypothetical protein